MMTSCIIYTLYRVDKNIIKTNNGIEYIKPFFYSSGYGVTVGALALHGNNNFLTTWISIDRSILYLLRSS